MAVTRWAVRMDTFNLKHARQARDYSQAELASNAALRLEVVVRAEKGVLIPLETARAISEALDVPTNSLLTLQYRQREGSPKGLGSSEATPDSAPQSLSAMVASKRILFVAAELRALRINSLADYISDLEEIGNDLEKIHNDKNADPEPIIRRALIALGGIFDAIGSERGAQIIVSGAVAGIVGVAGGSASLAYALTMAAWMGRDAYLEAVRGLTGGPPPPQKRRAKMARKS